MNLEPFHRILNKAMGLSPDSLGRSGVKHALSARMRITGYDEKQYLALLRSSKEEQNELIEEIVVPETWFFRDTKPFDLLFETAFSCKNKEFRVLSAPCSTGEEPYSIAMTLLGAGLTPDRFKVDGVDISQRALQKARIGIYTENSFRTNLPLYAEGFFQNCSEGKQIATQIKNAVNFYSGNIVEGCLPAGRYDAVFCRNLLIYLDDQSKGCLARILSEKLKENGILFVGHAEILPIFNEQFTPVRKKGVFALKKGPRKMAALSKNTYCPETNCDLQQIRQIPPPREIKKTIKPPQPETPPKKTQPSDKKITIPSIAEVKELADRGLTGEALNLCSKILNQKDPEPELLHLSGLLHEAEGNISIAEECYGKALYLDPRHVESLVHLALLFENRGEFRKAELLRNRVRRAENS